jgi:hypothetical protein
MVLSIAGGRAFHLFREGGKVMTAKKSEGKEDRVIPKSSEGNWYLIMCSWETGADDEAVQRFHHLYTYFSILTPTKDPKVREDALAKLKSHDPHDPRLTLVPESLKSLNLIGRRKFVIICQITSENCNRELQTLSREISLGAPVSVEIFPATYVHDLIGVLPPPMEETALRSKKMREPYQKSKKMTPKAR